MCYYPHQGADALQSSGRYGPPSPGFLDRLLEHRRLARLEIAAELTG
jgi:hypothetical protein